MDFDQNIPGQSFLKARVCLPFLSTRPGLRRSEPRNLSQPIGLYGSLCTQDVQDLAQSWEPGQCMRACAHARTHTRACAHTDARARSEKEEEVPAKEIAQPY